VIIDRLPFAVPSDPIVAAREKPSMPVAQPFFEYQLPSAVSPETRIRKIDSITA